MPEWVGQFGAGSMRPERVLAMAPEGQRLGLLTYPSWLVSHSDATDNHAIRRGKWIREHLLGGGIPDVPITVNAMLPDEPKSTLRQRMRVTQESYCWNCPTRKWTRWGCPLKCSTTPAYSAKRSSKSRSTRRAKSSLPATPRSPGSYRRPRPDSEIGGEPALRAGLLCSLRVSLLDGP